MSDFSKTAHDIKHRKIPKDDFTTPERLVQRCISVVNLIPYDVVLDAAYGCGVFFDNYPEYVIKYYCDKDSDFLFYPLFVDWIITNPPYSNLDKWMLKSCSICRKGFAYLLGINNLTPKRIELANDCGFGLISLHLCKVFKWFGMSCFVVFERGKPNIITYDRMVWK